MSEEEKEGAVGEPPDGSLGDVASDLYYRRVWQHSGAPGANWQVALEGPVRSPVGPNCTFNGPTFCSIAPPYVFERWWRWSPGTWGTSSSAWQYAGDRQNWGATV